MGISVGFDIFKFGTQAVVHLETDANVGPITVELGDGTPVPLSSMRGWHVGAFEVAPDTEATELRIKVGDSDWQECRARWAA